MQQNPRIKVHTSIAPSNEAVKTDKKIRWRVLPQARGQRVHCIKGTSLADGF